MEPMKPMQPMKPMEPMQSQPPWWPDKLGQPSTTGSQDDLKYAYFADQRRLAVSRASKITLYDTGSHQITGAAQQQSGAEGDLAFSTSDGEITLSSLPVVG